MVIQRIQTLYLLVALVLMAIFAFLTSFTITTGSGVFQVGAVYHGIVGQTSPHMLLLCLNALIVVITAIAIFSYKNLKFQLRLCFISLLLTMALFASLVVMAVTGKSEGELCISFSNIMPILAIVFIAQACVGISSDQKLLSDSTRIR